jgi:YidC/Oxa1 family membrane protein insertase
MEKRTLLAIFLSMVVLLTWGYFEQKKVQKTRLLQEQMELKADKEEPLRVQAETKPQPAPEEVGRKVPAIEELTRTPSYLSGKPGQVKDIVVESDLTRITLTSLGARLKSFQLKQYKDRDGNILDMLPDVDYRDMPLQIDLRQENGKLVTASGRELDASLLNSRVNGAAYEVNTQRLVLSDSRPTGVLSMSYHDASGVKVIKEFTFYHDKYAFDLNVKIEGLARYPGGVPYRLIWGSAINEDKRRKGRQLGVQVITFDGKETKKRKLSKLKGELEETEPIQWVALGTKYFVVAMLPGDSPAPAALGRGRGGKLAIGMGLHAQKGKTLSSPTIYVGPKESKRLASYGSSLEMAIDYGWTLFGKTITRGLAKPLLAALLWFYSFTHNYGVAIILLTVIIKIAFYPLTQKSFLAMQRMQELQPKIKALQERYKNDRQRLNQEMMQLYRTHKANPMGGCLPMLAQLPIFYALYMVLMYSIELRQAPFIWWIKDLSDYDPYFVTPLLMGVTMFLQQKMSPTMGDPRQAKMMLMMPVIFTVMFIYFPSGLVIYWMVNNLLTIAQQYFIKRKAATAPAVK